MTLDNVLRDISLGRPTQPFHRITFPKFQLDQSNIWLDLWPHLSLEDALLHISFIPALSSGLLWVIQIGPDPWPHLTLGNVFLDIIFKPYLSSGFFPQVIAQLEQSEIWPDLCPQWPNERKRVVSYTDLHPPTKLSTCTYILALQG